MATKSNLIINETPDELEKNVKIKKRLGAEKKQRNSTYAKKKCQKNSTKRRKMREKFHRMPKKCEKN